MRGWAARSGRPAGDEHARRTFRSRLRPETTYIQNRRRWTMTRLSMSSLVVSMLYALIPYTALAQKQSAGLPDGEGKTLVESMCTACHPANQITRSSGYTLAGWKELTGTMLDLSRSPETQDKIT